MNFGSLFSGCGGMDQGLEAAGLRCAWQVENDPACNRVLTYHWPDVPRFGDVKGVDPAQLAPVALLAGGSPCQDLSVAGRRAGLDGERSGLFYQFVRLADSLAPRWLLFENVYGLLSSQRGEDFAVVLREFTGFWPAVPADGWRTGGVCIGPKRWCVWRVLDSQHFGVPQRRRRLFLVTGAGVRPAPEILLEPDCLPRDSPARGEAREGTAALLAGGAGGRGWRTGADEAAGGQLVAGTLGAEHGRNRGLGQENETDLLVARAVTTREGSRMEPSTETFIAHTLRSEGADASEDGTGRGTPLVAFSCKDSGADAGELAHTLRAMGRRDSWENGGGQVAVAFDWQSGGDVRHNVSEHHTSALQASQVPAVLSIRERSRDGGRSLEAQEDVAYALTPGTGGHGDARQIASTFGVRRLTPRECERLQGYPDDWTRYGADGKELSDSARYRMIGNGVTASVARWIGERVSVADEAAIAEEAIPIRGIADTPLSAHDSLEMRNPVTVGLLGETATGRRLRRG